MKLPSPSLSAAVAIVELKWSAAVATIVVDAGAVLGLCAVVTLWATFVVANGVAAAPRRGAQSPTAGWLSSLSVGPLGLPLALGCGVTGVMGIFAHWSKSANSRFHELSAWKPGRAW